MKILPSTRRSDWERRWDRSQPKDWEGGGIVLEGDASRRLFWRELAAIAVVVAAFYFINWAFTPSLWAVLAGG